MIHGFDNIILACGPHCSGKTFNITGWNRKCEGIAPRLIDDMLALQTDGHQRAEGSVYAMSCVEIKSNQVFDLLNDEDNDSMARRRPCLAKNVSKHEFVSPGTARQMLRKASAKRFVTVREDNEVPPSHVCDFVITLYCWHASPGDDATTVDSSCAKVHIVELAGVGPHNAKPLKYQIQTNRTAMEFTQFLENINSKDDMKRDHWILATSALVNYCKISFSKRHTTLRVLCHIRPELEFLSSNLSVLKFGETLRKLKTSEISLLISKSETTELQMQMEHLTHEMRLYGNLKGLKSMFNMTAAHYDRLRNEVLNFLQFKTDDIVLRKWNHVDAYTILSVFREYFKKISTKENNKNNANRFKYGRFPLKSLPMDKDEINQMVEDTKRTVNEKLLAVLCCDDDAPTDERQYYWDVFLAANPAVILKRETILAKIRDTHRSFETALGRALDVQGELTRTRDAMDRLRGERHVDGNELYDRDANAIVPDAERLAVLSTWRADAEMVGAYDGFVRARTYLHRTVADCSKLDDAVHAHFEEFVRIQNEEKITGDLNTESGVQSVTVEESPSTTADSKTRLDKSGRAKRK